MINGSCDLDDVEKDFDVALIQKVSQCQAVF